MKNKNVAGILALLVGIFGTHRFYLGQRFLGAVYFLMFWAGLGITIEEGNPIVMLLPALLSIVDGIVFLAMPWEDFDRRYNKAYFKRQQEQPPAKIPQRVSVPVGSAGERSVSSWFEQHKREGIRKFRGHDYSGAVADFLEALRVKENDPAMCFNLACCYSMLKQTVPAMYYLELAVGNGFEDWHKIHHHQALDFLRAQPQFERFAGGAKAAEPAEETHEPQTAEEFLELNMHGEVEIPEPLLKLEDLKKRGILTEEEFEMQRQKMLGYR